MLPVLLLHHRGTPGEGESIHQEAALVKGPHVHEPLQALECLEQTRGHGILLSLDSLPHQLQHTASRSLTGCVEGRSLGKISIEPPEAL